MKYSLLLRRTRIPDENQPPEQGGFHSGFSTTDHLQAINEVMEKTEEFNLKIYMAFIDCKKCL
jgi:hypothetical protein